MYGIVNKALMELVVAEHGTRTWQRIRKMAGVEEEVFLSSETYPDETTYQLVQAAASELSLEPQQVLERFGRWWVLKTGRDSYGHLMSNGGRNLGEFLINLPNFHTRIVMMYPDLRPPEFECSDEGPGRIRLHYRSTRRGLAPFVTGLLYGLGEMFDTEVVVVQERSVDAGTGDHDVFLITWPPVHTQP